MADPVGKGFARQKLLLSSVGDGFQDSGWQRASENVAGSTARGALKQLVAVLVNRKDQPGDFWSNRFQLFQAERARQINETLISEKELDWLARRLFEGSGRAVEGRVATKTLLLVDAPGQRLANARIRLNDGNIEPCARAAEGGTGDASRYHHRNAGFIRQRLVRHFALPDKSGVPAGEPLAVGGAIKMRLRARGRPEHGCSSLDCGVSPGDRVIQPTKSHRELARKTLVG